MTRRKVLFNTPCYFHTYFLQIALRKMSVGADTYVHWNYPNKLLWYKSDEMIRPLFNSENIVLRFLNNIQRMYLYLTSESIISLGNVIGGKWGHIICNVFGRKQLCILSSCAMDARRSTWISQGKERLCNNCGLYKNGKARCSDQEADDRYLDRKKFSVGEISSGAIPFCEAPNEKAIPFICCDKEFFNPDLVIPEKFKIKKKEGFTYIIHSYAKDKDRLSANGLNPIKGTALILDTIERLKEEGYKIEIINPTNVHQTNLRFLQLQADFCVEELNYGWWGSTPLECAALGIPTILYLDPEFLEHWKTNFGDLYELIPFYNANPSNLDEAIKTLCNDTSLRMRLGKKSLEFADKFLDPEKNATHILNLINE